MKYSPKLKKAAAEIKQILEKHDIAGVVALHTPGFGEYVNHLSPSYSAAKFENDQIKVKIKASELEGGVKQAKQLAHDTYNMTAILSEMCAVSASSLIELHSFLKQKYNGTEFPGNHSSHTEQNN